MVCLMASTVGSCTASRSSCTTGSNDLERVMQQHVAGVQAREDRILARQPPLWPDRLVRRKSQRRRIGLVDQLVQPHQVDRTVHSIERHVGQAELLQQELGQLVRTGVHHFETDGLAEVARRQARAQRLAQVADVVIVDLEIGIARDAELGERLDLASREQLAEVRADHAGQQHERLAARGTACRAAGSPAAARGAP